MSRFLARLLFFVSSLIALVRAEKNASDCINTHHSFIHRPVAAFPINDHNICSSTSHILTEKISIVVASDFVEATFTQEKRTHCYQHKQQHCCAVIVTNIFYPRFSRFSLFLSICCNIICTASVCARPSFHSKLIDTHRLRLNQWTNFSDYCRSMTMSYHLQKEIIIFDSDDNNQVTDDLLSFMQRIHKSNK